MPQTVRFHSSGILNREGLLAERILFSFSPEGRALILKAVICVYIVLSFILMNVNHISLK